MTVHLIPYSYKEAKSKSPDFQCGVAQLSCGAVFIAGYDQTLVALDFKKDKEKLQSLWPEAVFTDNQDWAASMAPVLEQAWRGDGDLTLTLHGTAFQRVVWSTLLDIPYGQTTSYSAIAKAIGRPKAVRAVGTAIGANPVPVIIPCHRVLPKAGGIGGFSGGAEMKEKLLQAEGIAL